MGYILKDSVLRAYMQLSKLTASPATQGATQKVSALRYFIALDQFYTYYGTNCDINSTEKKDKYTTFVGNVVKVNNELYTSNFYYPLQNSNGDFNCGSNFYSVNVVRLSTENPNNTYEFPRRGKYPLFEVKNGVLIRNAHLYKNLSHYLNNDPKMRVALVIWLMRDDFLENDNIESLRTSFIDKYSKELVEALFPYTDGIYYNEYLNYSDKKISIDANDIKNLFTSSNNRCEKFSNMKYRHYIVAIKSKPFLLLAGISGTGKSRIVRELARACWDEDSPEYLAQKPKNFEMIQVKPNWHDSSELIGYVSRINGEKFVIGPFLKFLVRAIEDPDVPYFLCLDEMNLAPVEQYFAEYLSVIESRKVNSDGEMVTDPIVDYDPTDAYKSLIDQLFADNDEERKSYLTADGGKRLSLPSNLIVVGTVNMDETTFSFSRKVLDRAMTIEMNNVDLKAGLTEKYEFIGKLGSDELIGTAVEGVDVYEDNKEVCDKVLDYLVAVNTVLDGTPFKIAYRTRNEFLLYVVNNLPYSKNEDGTDISQGYVIARALDEVTNMKILPRIEGDETKVSFGLLDGLTETIINGLKAVAEDFTSEDSVSLAKLKEMKRRLETSGYTSYWS